MKWFQEEDFGLWFRRPGCPKEPTVIYFIHYLTFPDGNGISSSYHYTYISEHEIFKRDFGGLVHPLDFMDDATESQSSNMWCYYY